MIEVDDLAATVESMKGDGFSFRNEFIRGPGGQQVLAEDPAGNPTDLFERALSRIAPPTRRPAAKGE